VSKGKEKLKDKLKNLMKDEVKAGQKALDEVFDKQTPTGNKEVDKAINKLSKDAAGAALDLGVKAATDPKKAKQAATEALPKLAETGIKGAGEIAKGALADPIKNATKNLGDAAGPVGTLLKGASGAVIDNVLGYGSDMLTHQINDWLDGKHIGALNFVFMTWNDQEKKLVYDQWYVDKVTGTEEIGKPYEIFADLKARKGAEADTLLGVSCWLWGHRSDIADKKLNDTEDKYFGPNENHDISWGGWCGIIDQIKKKDSKTLRVRIVPGLATLKHRRDTRIFQDKTVPEILEEVLNAALEPFHRAVSLEKLECAAGEYPKREYCVQFDETDLDFATRLMEEEGLAFYFRQPLEHPSKLEKEQKIFGAESLFITDQFTGFDKARTRSKTSDESWSSEFEYNSNKGNRYTGEAVESLEQISQRGTRSLYARGYDWTNPDLTIEGSAKNETEDNNVHEFYTWTPKLNYHKYNEENGKYEEHDVNKQIGARLGSEIGDDVVAKGTSRVVDFGPGLVFKLIKHKEQDFNGEYVLTKVVHSYDSAIDRDGETPGTYIERYTNTFEAVPISGEYPTLLKFVPARKTPRPRVYGIQTARVVGPEGDDTIYTDQFGRIKVRFHWDRLDIEDEKRSCWIRVGQNVAGNDFGFVFTPRIGMEVIVQFIDGDPDRPIVTGALYNGVNRPPVTVDDSAREDGASNDWSIGSEPETADSGKKLPDTKTRSFIRTRSTPTPDDDPNAFNEISFEDAAGSEQIFVQAQKDYVEFVKHDHKVHIVNDDYESVDNDQRVRVGNNREKTVDNDEKTRVAGNRTEEVFKNETITVKGSRSETVKGSESITVTKDQTITITDGNRTRTVSKGSDTLKVEGSRFADVTGDVIETYKANHSVTVTGSQSSDIGQQLYAKAGEFVEFESGGNKLAMTNASGEVNLYASTQLMAYVPGGSNITLNDAGDATFEAKKFALTGSETFELTVGASSIAIDGQSITITSGGSSIKIDSSGVTVTGPEVKLNC
jgi:type VI secretion system secreted protein VgrG